MLSFLQSYHSIPTIDYPSCPLSRPEFWRVLMQKGETSSSGKHIVIGRHRFKDISKRTKCNKFDVKCNARVTCILVGTWILP